jgi:hypothetical protein
MRRAFTLAICASTLAAGCMSQQAPPEVPVRTLDVRADAAHPPTFMGLPLETGQIILTEASGALSFFFPLIPERFYRFTHAGIVVFEDGKPYVYDTVGELNTLSAIYASRPTDAIAGAVRRSFFYDYVKANLYAEVYDPPEEIDVAKLESYVQSAWRNAVPFDPYFNNDDHAALFCTELVSQALEHAGAKPIVLAPLRPNRSLRVALEWLQVPTDESLPAGLFADPARYRGAIGGIGSLTAARCYYAAKEELYRRFTESQKLGFIFRLDGLDIQLRDEIDDFVRKAIALFNSDPEAPDLETVKLAISELAAERFGELPD